MELENVKRQGVNLFLMKSENTEEYYEVGKKFITELLSGMGVLAKKYYEHGFYDLPYLQGERQLESIMLPTLSKICKGAVLSELSIERKFKEKGGEEVYSSGRVDYRCEYEKYIIALEVKHGYDHFGTDVTRQSSVKKRWGYMTTRQLQSIRGDLKRRCPEESKGIIRLGLHFISSYSSAEPDTSIINQYKKDLPQIFERLYNDVSKSKPAKTTPDYLACWLIPKKIVLEWEKTYPGLILMGKIFKPMHK